MLKFVLPLTKGKRKICPRLTLFVILKWNAKVHADFLAKLCAPLKLFDAWSHTNTHFNVFYWGSWNRQTQEIVCTCEAEAKEYGFPRFFLHANIRKLWQSFIDNLQESMPYWTVFWCHYSCKSLGLCTSKGLTLLSISFYVSSAFSDRLHEELENSSFQVSPNFLSQI